MIGRRHPPPISTPRPPPSPEVLEFTAFALDQWKDRVERDEAAFAILATHVLQQRGGFLELLRLAEARDIPVIDQGEWILDQGAEFRDAHWGHDTHWNPQGHQWAAEAVFAWLERRQSVCGE